MRSQRPSFGDDWPPLMLMQSAAGKQQAVAVPPGVLNSPAHAELVDHALTLLKPAYFAHVLMMWTAPPPPSCETCNGEGMLRGDSGLVRCPTCNGRGGPAADLSAHPDRQEIVMVFLGDALGNVEMWSARVFRPHRKPPTLGPWEQVREPRGRLANALRRTPPPPSAAHSKP